MEQPIEYEDLTDGVDLERQGHRTDDDAERCWCDPEVEVVRNDDGEYVGELVIHRGFEE
jgi:hypothetical protein